MDQNQNGKMTSKLTSKDRRFLEYWGDQRKGTKREYYVTYGIGWTIAFFLGLYFGLKLFLTEIQVGTMLTLYIIVPLSIIIALLVTHLTYTKNEKKFAKIKGQTDKPVNS